MPFKDARAATWRGTTAVDPKCDTLALSFDTASGDVVRLEIPARHAAALRDSINDVLRRHRVNMRTGAEFAAAVRKLCRLRGAIR